MKKNHFISNLRHLMRLNGVTQEALCEMLGISRAALTKWLSGDNFPTINNLVTLKEIFKCESIDDLIFKDMTMPATPPQSIEGEILSRLKRIELTMKRRLGNGEARKRNSSAEEMMTSGVKVA